MLPVQICEKGSDLLLPLQALSIARCIVDHAFSLEAFRGNDVVTVRIEGSFTITENSMRRLFDPNEPFNLGPAIKLVRAVVARARATSEGRLDIEFEDGRILAAEPNEDFEAWELVGPASTKVICRAGGGISTWDSACT